MSRPTPSIATQCEPLEPRALCDATSPEAAAPLPTFSVNDNGTLILSGTSGDDRVTIRTTAEGMLIRLNEDGSRRKRYAAGGIKGVDFDGGGGSDSLVVDDVTHFSTSTRRVERRTVQYVNGRTTDDFATVAEPGRDAEGATHWLRRYKRQQKNLTGVTATTVFIGDSMTERMPVQGPEQWASLKTKYDAADLGFSGDTTSSLLYRLNADLLKNIWPRTVFLSIGTNNVSLTDDVESTLRGIREVMKTIHAQRPQAQIVLSSILPRGDHGDASTATADAVNAKLGVLAAEFDAVFSDAAIAFAPAQVAKRDFEDSSLHLTRFGYARWLPVIATALAKAKAYVVR